MVAENTRLGGVVGVPSTSPSLVLTMMKPSRDIGVVGHGAYVPRYRLPGAEVSRVWTGGSCSPIAEKSVPGLDEDVVTMSIEAARNALCRADIEASRLRAVWVGSESHPYAVKPTGTVVAEAIGATPNTLAGDWQFACKAGTEALQAAFALVGSGCADYALAIGMDTAQGRPADALEYTASAGGAAFVVGPAEQASAVLEGSLSFVTDTPDFWRREQQVYPQHAARFTGEPAYFAHVTSAARQLMDSLGTSAADYRYVAFHQPNPKFPLKAAKRLGFERRQVEAGQLVNQIGNTYAGSALLGLTAVLDQARAGDRILVVSFGSGAGSDAISLRVTERIERSRGTAPATARYVARRTCIDYARYARHRKKIA